MTEFIDLAGQSGARYRFHRVEDVEALPAIAGNFVYVRGDKRGVAVVCAGTGESLITARKLWGQAVEAHGAQALYIRRNVSRRSRRIEHEDIIAQAQPAMDAAEDFGE